jgi:flagellar motor switch protein FliN/FliY
MAISEQKYVQLWATSIASVLGQISGKTFSTEVLADPASATDVVVPFSVTKAATGKQAFRVATTDALALARILVADESESTELTSDHQDAVAELFRQIAGDAAVRFKSETAVEVEFAHLTSKPEWKPSSSLTVTATAGDRTIRIGIDFDAELERSLSQLEAATSPRAAVNAEQEQRLSPITERNLDLLMDVSLNVKLRFGQRQIPLRELLDLSDGAVLELDQEIDDPAELLLGNRVIARGEVVIVDGNYGIRVTEVVSPQQRMAARA